MALVTPTHAPRKITVDPEIAPRSQEAASLASDRDRMLAALAAVPHITDEEAEQIRRAVGEAREASIAAASA